MSDNELSESELIGLLGTYADALEKHTTIAPQSERASEISIHQAGAEAPAEGASEMSEEQMGEQPEVIELDVVPTAATDPGRGRMLLVAAGVAVAALVGAVFALNNDPTDVDTVEVAEEAEASSTTTTVEVSADESTDAVSSDAATSEAASSFVGFGGPGSVVFANGEYVSIGGGPDGAVVSRSSNGTDWTTEVMEGIPENAFPTQLIEVDGTWLTIAEVWPEFDEEETDHMFMPEQPERLVATSTDLKTWSLSDFPDLEFDDGEFAYISGIAASGDRVAIAVEVQPGGLDEYSILIENNLVTEADLDNMCGSEHNEGGDIIFYSCDFDEMAMEEGIVATDDSSSPATTVAPAEPFEEPFEETELLRLSPGDVGYDELNELYDSYGAEESLPVTTVFSGPVGGPFESADLPISGYGTSLVGTDDGFLAISSGFGPESSGASSPDGVTWTETEALPFVGVSTATALDGNIVVVGQNEGGPGTSTFGVAVSSDLGATWTESTIATALFSPWGEAVAGPAGVAVHLQGSTSEEANFDPFLDMEPVSIESDGYTMTMDLTDGTATLADADGTIIHELPETAFMEGGVEGVARFEGQYDETLIWLDPATGDDLVTFTEEQFDEAFDAAMPEFEDEVIEEMLMATETWFSTDGITWTLLDSVESTNINESYSMVAAVGDDEVLVRSETFVEPPAELFAFEEEGREPTPDEEEALDAYFMEQTNTSEWTAIPVN